MEGIEKVKRERDKLRPDTIADKKLSGFRYRKVADMNESRADKLENSENELISRDVSFFSKLFLDYFRLLLCDLQPSRRR